MVSRVVPVEPFDLVVFGATGDLARRKLIPALYHRMADGQMPENARIIGTARSEMDADGFRTLASGALDDFVTPDDLDTDIRERFLDCLDYLQLDVSTPEGWNELRGRLSKDDRPVAYYLSVAPRFFGMIAEGISKAGLVNDQTRIVVEKPLGHDLESARTLNRQLAEGFHESQIYRIDHYLGKETVQNLMALRFANTLTAMEPPARFEPDAVRDEKLKVLRALQPLTDPADAVRGQYRAGTDTNSYHTDSENADSRTESFVALKASVSNWRWAGVPFYLRTGKRLRSRMSEISIQFKDVPHSIFAASAAEPSPNVLAIRLQPDEGITLSMTIKDPGPGGMRLTGTKLDMSFADSLSKTGMRMPDAYERLVMDVIRGDQTLFMRGDEVEAAWSWVDPIIEGWRNRMPNSYDAGSSGPEDALMLLHRDDRRWREIVA